MVVQLEIVDEGAENNSFLAIIYKSTSIYACLPPCLESIDIRIAPPTLETFLWQAIFDQYNILQTSLSST
jgi:hypothetical protein